MRGARSRFERLSLVIVVLLVASLAAGCGSIEGGGAGGGYPNKEVGLIIHAGAGQGPESLFENQHGGDEVGLGELNII